MQNYFQLLAIFLIVSCGDARNDKTQNSSLSTAPSYQELVIDRGKNGQGADIKIAIISTSLTDTSIIYHALSTYNGNQLGLNLALPKKVGSNPFGGKIVLNRMGKESDYLLQTLAKLYRQRFDTALKFKNSVAVNGMNLEEYAKEMSEKEHTTYTPGSQYKLFFESDSGEDYAELYMKINPAEH